MGDKKSNAKGVSPHFDPGRCYHLISRVAHRVFEFEGLQAANRKDRAAMTRKTYCGNQVCWFSRNVIVVYLLRKIKS